MGYCREITLEQIQRFPVLLETPSLEDVKILRQVTNIGWLKCKEALKRTNGDIVMAFSLASYGHLPDSDKEYERITQWIEKNKDL